jgi:hypothetical protein
LQLSNRERRQLHADDEYAFPDPHFPSDVARLGLNWVGDLAMEADFEVQSETGSLLLTLVEGGAHHQCRIDVATGIARLELQGLGRKFADDSGKPAPNPQAETAVRGPGKYSVRLSNVDDQMRLWVNGRVVEFDGPTTYLAPQDAVPTFSPTDPGDLAPAGIGSHQLAMTVHRLKILRDVYYIATTSDGSDYRFSNGASAEQISALLTRPQAASPAALARLFDARWEAQFELGPDEFFPLGDNSPQSKDARLWADPYEKVNHAVERKLLTGKALLIYWPHHWKAPVPFLPNFSRMGLIR